MNFPQKLATALTLLAASSAWAAQGALAARPGTTRSVININNVLIPSGFDNNEPTAIVSGLFPNSCYSWDKAEVKDIDATTHEVRSFANVRPGMCLMVIIPFTEEVSLGKLVSGNHTIRFMNGDGTYLEKIVSVQ